MNIELARISMCFFKAGDVIKYPSLVNYYQDPQPNSGRFWYSKHKDFIAFGIDPTIAGQKIQIFNDAIFFSVTAIGDGIDPGFTNGAMSTSLQLFYAPIVIKKSIPKLIEVGKGLLPEKDNIIQFIAAFEHDTEDSRLWNYVGRLQIDTKLVNLLVDRKEY